MSDVKGVHPSTQDHLSVVPLHCCIVPEPSVLATVSGTVSGIMKSNKVSPIDHQEDRLLLFRGLYSDPLGIASGFMSRQKLT